MTGVGVGNKSDDEPLLQQNINITDHNRERYQSSRKFIEGMVNYKGEKLLTINNQQVGGWKSASPLLLIGVADAFAIFGILSNLISYLTNHLGQSTATAALNVDIWAGVLFMLPLLIAFVADSYIGRFRTVLFSSFFQILGLGLLTISALNGSIHSTSCVSNNKTEADKSCANPSSVQVIFFFLCLYLVALGHAGNSSCATAFGADNFDGQNVSECKSKSSFFTWMQIGGSVGTALANTILNYIQDNLGWGLGFGISCISLLAALIIFLCGIKRYRYSVTDEEKENPLLGILEVLVAAAKNWRIPSPSNSYKEEASEGLITMSNDAESSSNHVTVSKVEDAKSLLRLMPVWIICLIFPVVISQSMTLFTKQSSTMDRTLCPEFQIPAASINIFNSLSVVLFAVIYDRLFVPLARAITGKPNGITTLQRIGGGIVVSAVSMVGAAIVEHKRLQTAFDFGLVDMPNETVPMSVWWLVPQYLLIGLANLFASVGLQELFYDQVPNGLKSVGVSLISSMFGIGSVISGFLITAIQQVTSVDGQYGWFSDNLNRAHLDYFYWLLAGLSTLEMIAFFCYSKLA